MNPLQKVFWFVIGFASCLFILILIPFKLNPEFNATDALQLAVTVLIAILIQYYATEKYSDFRFAKNLLITHADEVAVIIKEAHKLFLDCAFEKNISEQNKRAILLIARNFSNSIYTLEQGMHKCRVSSSHLETIKGLNLPYREVLTGGNFPAPYTAAALSHESKYYLQITDAIQSLIFEINNK